MKNQYVGDVGDYGKYGLLRFLANKGIKIGVNWYYTDKDDSTDGNKIDYLKDENERIYDPLLFAKLKSMQERNISYIEKNDIIPNAIFYNKQLNTKDTDAKERKAVRDNWHNDALKTLQKAELIFSDPDNGSIEDKYATRKNGEKYISLKELEHYYHREQDVVYYCHRARRNDVKWKQKMQELSAICNDVKIIVLTFRRGTQRSYIFGIHPERYEFYNNVINEFMKTEWGTVSIKKKTIPFMREL